MPRRALPSVCCLYASVAVVVLVLSMSPSAAIEIGEEIGPYTVTRILPVPPGGIGDIEFSESLLWSLESYDGIIHRLDPLTGEVQADYWVPGESLHDEWPYDGPRGLAWDGSNFFMATYSPNYLRKLTLGEPPDVTIDWITTLPDWPMDLAYGDAYLYYPEYLGPIRRLDPADGQVVGTIPSPSDYIYGMTFDGTNLVAAYGVGGGDRIFWVIDPGDGTIHDTWTVPGWTDGIGGMAFDLSTETLYVGSGNGIVVAQASTVSVGDDLTGGERFVLSLAPNPIRSDGDLMIRLSRPAAGRLELFDVAGRRVGQTSIHSRSAAHHLPMKDLLDRSQLPAGVYLLRWRSDRSEVTKTSRLTILME